MADESDLLGDTRASLLRIQKFEAEGLIQRDRLGELSFDDVVLPARKIVTVFAQIPQDALEIFPDNELKSIKTEADNIFALFEEIKRFDLNDPDPRGRRQGQIDKMNAQYQRVFSNLFNIISYSMARTVDFNQLSSQGRATVQEIRDKTDLLLEELEKQRVEARTILDDVRKAAEEQGVSQQAFYFAEEAKAHKSESDKWRNWTIAMSAVVGLYGVFTLFIHKIPLLTPASTAEVVQLTASKLLIFFVLTYVLFLCGRKFMSNRHNEIVNKHRQNALMTYKAMVDAGRTPEARDVVLTHAAASIYQLHDTGYVRSADGDGPSSNAVVGLLPRATLPVGHSAQ